MTYEECMAVLDQFEQTHPEVMMSRNFHGLQVVHNGQKFILQLVVTAKIDSAQLPADERMPASVSYTYEGKTATIETEVVEQDYLYLLQCKVKAGHRATYSSTGLPYGTAGWNVYFQNQNVYVCLSNSHVIVDPNNPDPRDSNVYLNSANVAKLHAFVLNDTWDYALARYNDATDACSEFRACADGSVYPYPQQLARDITFQGEYYKVGARTPICRTGRLKGVGNRRVEWDDGTTSLFRGQLIFEKMSDRGDSGSLTVRVSDNTVTGLNFAGNSDETAANPLFKIGWNYLGSIRFEGAADAIPMFDDLGSVAQGSRFLVSSAAKINYPSADLSSAGLTQIVEGKYFLGEAIKDETWNAWIKPIPPPIRNVEVEVVFIRRVSTNVGVYKSYYLCFG